LIGNPSVAVDTTGSGRVVRVETEGEGDGK
jgi:hypothetical protein